MSLLRKPTSDRRRRVIKVRVTGVEYLQLRASAHNVGLPLAVFMRRIGLGHRLPVRRSGANAALLRELNAIGNNVNQLARRANSGNYPGKDELDVTLSALIKALNEVPSTED